MKERQEIELTAQRATLQEQRQYIDILDTALSKAQENVVRVEKEHSERVSAGRGEGERPARKEHSERVSAGRGEGERSARKEHSERVSAGRGEGDRSARKRESCEMDVRMSEGHGRSR